jgi:hypothetical protein
MGNLWLGAFVGFLITMFLGFIFPFLGHLIGGFIGGLVGTALVVLAIKSCAKSGSGFRCLGLQCFG